MTVEHYYKELINVESSELYKRYISDDYVEEYRLACLKILKERDDFSKEETARKTEEASKEVYYEGYGFISSWKRMFKRCVDFDGRSCRSEFWYAHLNQFLMSILFMVLTVMELSFFSGIIMLYIVISVIPLWALAVRRLHDVGKSGWFLLLNYIPLGGIYLIILFCKDSEKGKNNYGENPKKRERKKENSVSVAMNLNNSDKQGGIESNQGVEFCRKCGAQILIDSVFCNKCGAKVEETKKRYAVRIFDATTHTLRKEMKDVDVTKFPPSKFADNDTYYAIETYRDEKKVRIYYTKENWDKQIETEISEEKI